MIRNLKHVMKALADSNITRINRINRSFLLKNNPACLNAGFARTKKDDSTSSLFRPVPIKHSQDGINVGAEITGTAIDKAELLKILNRFSQKRETRLLCLEHGLDRKIVK